MSVPVHYVLVHLPNVCTYVHLEEQMSTPHTVILPNHASVSAVLIKTSGAVHEVICCYQCARTVKVLHTQSTRKVAGS
jgi:hypothetical protein